MVCTGAALLNLSANGMRGTPRQQIGSPQPQATGCTPQGWLSPQGGLGRPEMGVARSPSQAGQGQCHSMPWAGEAPASGQTGLGRQMCWKGSGPGWGVRTWLDPCGKGGQVPASGAVEPEVQPERQGEGIPAGSWHISDHFCSPRSSSGLPQKMNVRCLEQAWLRPQ